MLRFVVAGRSVGRAQRREAQGAGLDMGRLAGYGERAGGLQVGDVQVGCWTGCGQVLVAGQYLRVCMLQLSVGASHPLRPGSEIFSLRLQSFLDGQDVLNLMGICSSDFPGALAWINHPRCMQTEASQQELDRNCRDPKR